MSTKQSIFFGLLLLIISSCLYAWLITKPPKPQKKAAVEDKIHVEYLTIKTQAYSAKINSYGRVQAHTQSQLSAEVNGNITWINPQLRAGNQLKKGELLLRIDSKDYASQIDMSQSQVIEARLNYEQELARSKQAKINWQRLKLERQPTNLVLRKPQLAAAKAAWDAARAELAMAKNNLSRTQVRAPYSGWVLSKRIDIGQHVSAGSILAEIYDSSQLEVRLPIALADLKLIDLPEDIQSAQDYPKALIINELGGVAQNWSATIVRSEAAVDTQTQQLYVIARIDSSAIDQHKRRLKLNQYVDAKIDARHIDNAILIPNSALYQSQYVYLIDQQHRVKKQQVSILWSGDQQSIVEHGLHVGDKLITTPLSDFSIAKLVQAKQSDIDKQMLEAKP